MRATLRRTRTTCAAVLLVAGLFAALGTATTSSAAASAACPNLGKDLPPNIWNGADGFWRDDNNWSLGVAPGFADGGSGYACIPSGTVTLTGVDDVRKVMALHVGTDASLVVEDGAHLFVRGKPAQASTIDGKLAVDGAAFGGEGVVKLRGRLVWHSDPDGPTSTLLTRECALVPDAGEDTPPARPAVTARPGRWEPCDSADGGHLDGPGGLLIVKSAGHVEVDGGGVSLADGYRLRIYGAVDVTGDGYVVADRGTATELRRTGKYQFENDGGYYEGEARFGETELSSFVNEGHLEKVDGDGVSAVDATYTQPEGEIKIESGSLRVASGTPVAARVDGGAAYGSGQCRRVGGSFGCRPRTDADDRQNAMLRVPNIDHDGADVTVSEYSHVAGLYSIGTPVLVHADDLDATKRHPAILTFRIDGTLLDPGQAHQRLIRVARDSDDEPGGYHRVRACRNDGRPPKGEQACVDRRGIAHVSSRTRNGDVIMVVRAIGTSRWICR